MINNEMLSEGIFYSYESLSFYKIFYSELGTNEIRELPSSLNSYLHRIVDVNSLTKNNNVNSACIGRYRDAYETDESTFDIAGYFVGLFEVQVDVNRDKSLVQVCNASRRLSKALLMAARAHSNQVRKSDYSPYIFHLIEVMNLLIQVGGIYDEDIVLCGILHDTIEDTKITKSNLLHSFGSRVANIVCALSDDKTLPLEVRRQREIKKLTSAPRSVKTIKLADICSNTSTIPKSWTSERSKQYLNWIEAVALICSDANEPLYREYLTRRSMFN